MRVLLIRHDDTVTTNSRIPQSLNRRQGILPHLGLGYIASVLAAEGHSVRLLDAQVLNFSESEILDYIKDFNPQLIGLNAKTPTVQSTLRLSNVIRCVFRKIKVVIGGPHTSLFPKETLKFCDYIVLGEGEIPMLRLCDAIDGKIGFNEVPGLGYIDGLVVYIGSPYIVQELDSLPFPAYRYMPMDRYSSIIGLHPVSIIMASRGCPYKCSFCYKTPSDQKYRHRSPKNIVDEIVYQKRKFGIREIIFYDDMMPPQFAAELCEEILRRGVKITWETPQRVDLVNLEVLKLMKQAGCRRLRFGVEQGDPHMMEVIEKKTTIDKVCEAFDLCRLTGIETFAYFIIGYLGETPTTIRKTIDLAKYLNPRYIMFTKVIPLPNTKLHDEAVSCGYLIKDYWEKCSRLEIVPDMIDFVPDTDKWVALAYREYYLRPSKVLSQIYAIRSWRDLKKNLAGAVGILKA